MPAHVSYKFAFFAYAYNLAEVTRAVEIAKTLREREAEIEFFSHGGYHENHITEAGFVINRLTPVVTPEKHEFLIGIEQGRTFRPPFTTDELLEHVQSEVSALHAFVPDAVYSGMNVPCCISARALGVPLISVLPTPVTAAFFQHRLASFPESHANVISNLLPQKWKDRFFNWLMPRAHIGIGRFNRVARQHGVPPFKAFIGGVFSGDLTLLADIPEITGIPESAFPPNYHYIGPLFAHLPLSLPEEVRHVFSMPGINLYCAMGSSAQPAILKKAIKAVIDSGHNTVIATTSILDPSELGALPENVYATQYLPAHQVNELADIAVIHGGQGTVQTACWAGTPIIGLALQFEQQANLDMIVQAGMGVRIPMHDYTKKKILFEINRVAEDSSFRQNALNIKKIMRHMDGAKNAANRILAFLKDDK
jgi:MGT family glycosyltransferase